MSVENPQIIKAGAKRYSLLIVALCFCLSLGSIGNAYAMYSHSMTDVESSAHGHISEGDVQHLHAVTDAQANKTHSSHDCCNDGETLCTSSGAACSIHCSASVTDTIIRLYPSTIRSNSMGEHRPADPLPVNLETPFKPPRT